VVDYRAYSFRDELIEKKPWKIIAHTDGLGGKACSREYFIVRALDSQAALRLLRITRPNLANIRCEALGEAAPETLDWLQVDMDVFSIQF
jgi:hypothetical protein